jgi:hypothetical protein
LRCKFVLKSGKNVTVTFNPADYPMRSAEKCRSKIQYECGQMIKKYYPSHSILEDFPTPEGFYLDFFIPAMNIAFEVQGEQHYKYNKFFYKNEKEFAAAKERDGHKYNWCSKNDIKLIIIRNKEELTEWFMNQN